MMDVFRVGVFLCAASFTALMASNLDHLIAPEIKNDGFYEIICELAEEASIQTILEIGSSSGEGSTEAFVRGIEKNPLKPTLFCMEVIDVRFKSLQERYKDHPQVQCYQCSSVPLSAFPTEEEVVNFFPSDSAMPGGTPNVVLTWLREDIDYLKTHDVIQNGIEWIKKENGIEYFDMVLIDGSEFTGKAELEQVYGAKYILLDDIRVYKNNANYERLLLDPQYRLLTQDWYLRNGYAVFVRI